MNENVSIGFVAKNWHVVAKSPMHRRNFVSVLCNGYLHLGTIHLLRQHMDIGCLEIGPFYLLLILKSCLHSD